MQKQRAQETRLSSDNRPPYGVLIQFVHVIVAVIITANPIENCQQTSSYAYRKCWSSLPYLKEIGSLRETGSVPCPFHHPTSSILFTHSYVLELFSWLD